MRAVDLIAHKRDGGEHSAEEVRFLVSGFVGRRIPDEQISAWLMAVCLRGLSEAEIDALCGAMVASGDVVNLSTLASPAVDKHSTGGVGDKVTLALGPIVAACGVPFAKMSGRGLGHTGGTLDKLEAIPGYQVDLGIDRFVAQLESVGCAVVAQSERLVPADRLLYALRDATATVPSPGLIATSVVSKKLAAGAAAILLDVKVGDGAFMRTVEEARELAHTMQGLGERAGRRVVCELTRMDAPLGRAVGNALEVAEAMLVLQGQAPDDLDDVVRSSASQLLELASPERSDGSERVAEAISSGAARAKARDWIRAQGGDPRVVDEPWAVLEKAPVVLAVESPSVGFVAELGALAIGLAATRLGAGRERKEDCVDPAVGIVCARKPGEPVETGAPLAFVHARTEAAALVAVAEVRAAYTIGSKPVAQLPIVIERVA